MVHGHYVGKGIRVGGDDGRELMRFGNSILD